MIATGSVIRKRILIVMAAFLALMLGLVAQLFDLQIVRAQELQQRAQRQWTSESLIAPRRGSILDRNGVPLAVSATSYTACATPRQVTDARAFARIVAPVLEMDEENIVKKISDVSKGSVILKRKLSREAAQALKTLSAQHKASEKNLLSGLYLEEDSSRYYPMGSFATQLLGLTTVDGRQHDFVRETREVDTAREHTDERHEHIVDERADNLSKRTADDHTDSHVHYVALHGKLFEFFNKSHNLKFLVNKCYFVMCILQTCFSFQ